MNRGAIKLRQVLKDRGDQQKLTDELDIGNGTVSKWLSGDRKPHAKYRFELEKLYRIEWRLWDIDVEKQSAVSR